jgi:ribose transport system substrate-binding protein
MMLASAAAVAESSENKTVYVILKALGNQYWSILQAGAEKAGADLGVKVVIQGVPNESDIEGQVKLLQDAVSAQATGIVIGPVDSVAMANPIKEAYESGTPVVLVDTTVEGDAYGAELMTNNVTAGEMAAEQLLKQLKDAGTSETDEALIAIQAGSAGSQTINDRLKGFNAYWDVNAPEAWKVLKDDIKINDGDISRAVGFCQDFLTTYPNLKAVFGPNNGSTVGFVTGLQEAKRTDIIMVGFDFSPEIEGMIRSGNYNVASLVQRQYFMGYQGVQIALELAAGGAIAEKSVDTGVLVVTPENVDDAAVQEVINPAAGK